MKTGSLRELIRAREFLHMPAVSDPLGGLLVQNSGFKVCFVGGYVTGAALAISEPLLTMTEQVALAGAVAKPDRPEFPDHRAHRFLSLLRPRGSSEAG